MGLILRCKCVYLDESAVKPNLIRDDGWSPFGEKIFGTQKGKREKNINIIAAENKQTVVAPFIYFGQYEY